MNQDELKSNLVYLINKYIEDGSQKRSLIKDISKRGFSGVKGILQELNLSSMPLDDKDSGLVKDIAYFYV